MKNEKNQDKLQDALGKIDEKLIARAAKQPMKYATKIKWISSVAAVLVVCIVFGALMGSGVLFGMRNPLETTVGEDKNNPFGNDILLDETTNGANPFDPIKGSRLLAAAKYPEIVKFPSSNAPNYANLYYEWSRERDGRLLEYRNQTGNIDNFVKSTVGEFLGGAEGENTVYSPLSVYMALAMLAESTGGNSRTQILKLLGVETIEQLRTQTKAIWNYNYNDGEDLATVLANSLWMNEKLSFNEETVNRLAENYYASLYQGEMGSDEYNQMLQDWMNAETRGLLKEQIDQIEMTPETILSLVSTLFFKDAWQDELSSAPVKKCFYGDRENVFCDFLIGTHKGKYYEKDNFTAVVKYMGTSSMYLILPNESIDIDTILSDEELLNFIVAPSAKSYQRKIIQLELPKFKVTSQFDLKDSLQNLGITDCFASERADFSPIVTENAYVSEIKHGATVEIDENGVMGSAYTYIKPQPLGKVESEQLETVKFTVDRPFLFVITGESGDPLFVGTVNQIE